MAHKTPFQIQEERNLLVPKHLTHIKTHKTTTYEPQMAIIPIQQKPNDGSTSQGVGRLKLCHTDAVDRERLKVNIKTMKNVSGDRMTHNMPFMIQKRRNIPLTQQLMCSKMHNRSLHGPQSAMSLFLQPLLEGLRSQSFDRTKRHVGNTICEKHLNMNVRTIKKWMNSSVKKEEYGEYAYSPGKEPKAPDKKTWHVDKRQLSRCIMHLGQRKMTMPETWWRESEVMQTCQQLQCDNSHTSYDSTHKCIKINEQ